MPRVTIDTTEAQSFEPVEPGTYPMTIEAAEATKSGKGDAMLNVAFSFEDPVLSKSAGKVFRNYMLVGKGAGFTREFLKAVTGQDFPVGQVLDFDTDDLVGRHIVAQVGNREYEGRLQNEVERVTSAA